MTALGVVLLQIGITGIGNYLDEIDLNTNYVKYEARLIDAAYRSAEARGRPIETWQPTRYGGRHGNAYAFRILEADGRVRAELHGELLSALSPWRNPRAEAQDFWLRRLGTGSRMHVAGGVHLSHGDRDLWVEVATLGDPAGAHVGIFAVELLADVWLPMIVLIALTFIVAVHTVRRALAPVIEAANMADSLSALSRNERFFIAGLPREVASLAAAINRLLDRTSELVRSQRMFHARAAHELRTPLSIMLLELGRSGGARLDRLELDVRAMSGTVDRLLTLSKLETAEAPEISEVDVAALATAVVEGMSDWARHTGHVLELRVNGPVVVMVDRFAIREALRNLVENAVRHTPAGASIRVEVGPGPSLSVDDSGPGIDAGAIHKMMEPFSRGDTKAEGTGLGLAIVARAAAMHGAELKLGRSTLGGARFELLLAADAFRIDSC